MIEEKNKIFIRLTDDKLFKETFGNPNNIRYLEDFIESYFHYEKGYLKNKLNVFYEGNIVKTVYNEKQCGGDLIVIVDKKITLNIEMYSRFNDEAYIKSKMYIMKISALQLHIGEKYKNIKNVKQINIIEKEKTQEYKLPNKIESIEEIIKDKIETTYYRLDLLPSTRYNEDRFMKWLYFIAAKSKEERESIALGDEILMDLDKWLEDYANDESLIEFFDDRYWDRRIEREEGRIEGEEEGIKKGSSKKAIEIAKNLKESNIPIDVIAESTGLPIEEIEKI